MNIFVEWMGHMGFHGKQVSEAGRSIGLKPRVTVQVKAGERELTPTERLAMSAVAAGLPEWSPENAEDFARVKAIIGTLKGKAA
ncbi:MAG: hypothetical protein CML31_05415 [Rhizobiales bacterium]|nr:hypothetical protein [Hoeflea sp.]MBG19392.1 hypothetical protein [Hyphomicrobiales bacterium]|tara:strand:+ start:33920 stop:34171 length:252 start_codon:yes stop_codon:yes gene_type:complete